jgi:hypothetical protein
MGAGGGGVYYPKRLQRPLVATTLLVRAICRAADFLLALLNRFCYISLNVFADVA